jgi:uncharacterized protein
MSEMSRSVLQRANDAVRAGDYEAFLTYCTEDTRWTFLGDRVLEGKQAVREYMREVYVHPPVVEVRHVVAQDDTIVALGEITLTAANGSRRTHAYSDFWRLENGKLAALVAFVVPDASIPDGIAASAA